jgi:hypothetical protein
MTTKLTALAHEVIPADLLTQVGRALFGDRWKADMAHALKVSVDRVDDWSKGRGNPPPQGVWFEIGGFIKDREDAFATLRGPIQRAAHEAWRNSIGRPRSEQAK